MNTHDRISKVGFKEGYLEVRVSHEDARQKKDTTIVCKDEPHSDLRAAFNALEEFVREVLLWPSNLYTGAVEVKSVSWSLSEGTDVEGAVISGAVKLEDDPSGFNWNTPHRPFDQYSEGGNAVLWSDDAQAAFRDVRKEVDAFIKGTKRRQGDLFSQPDGKSAAAGEYHDGDLRDAASRIGELTDAVVKVVDEQFIQPYLRPGDRVYAREAVDPVTGEIGTAVDHAVDPDEVERIGKAHGMPREIIDAVKDDYRTKGGHPVDFESRGDEVEGISPAGKTLVAGAVAKGFAEQTDKPNVIRMKGRKLSNAEA